MGRFLEELSSYIINLTGFSTGLHMVDHLVMPIFTLVSFVGFLFFLGYLMALASDRLAQRQSWEE